MVGKWYSSYMIPIKTTWLSPEDKAEFNQLNTAFNNGTTLLLSAVCAVLLSLSMLVGYLSYTGGAAGVDEFWIILPYHAAGIVSSVFVFAATLSIRKKNMAGSTFSDTLAIAQVSVIMVLFLISSHVEIQAIGIKNVNALIIVQFATGIFLRFKIAVTLTLETIFTLAEILLLFIEKNQIPNFYPSLINFSCAFVIASIASYLHWNLRKNHFLSTKKLMLLAMSDPLTRLHNRRSFDVYIEQEWKRAIEKDLYLIMLFIDVDSFKNYNDLYGHLEGDRCLSAIADTISASVRKNDFIARYGGEEFVVALTSESADVAVRVADSMVNAMRKKGIPHGDSVEPYVTLSIGCMICRPGRPDAVRMSEFIRMADDALYMAKEQGRNRVVVHPRAEADSRGSQGTE